MLLGQNYSCGKERRRNISYKPKHAEQVVSKISRYSTQRANVFYDQAVMKDSLQQAHDVSHFIDVVVERELFQAVEKQIKTATDHNTA